MNGDKTTQDLEKQLADLKPVRLSNRVHDAVRAQLQDDPETLPQVRPWVATRLVWGLAAAALVLFGATAFLVLRGIPPAGDMNKVVAKPTDPVPVEPPAPPDVRRGSMLLAKHDEGISVVPDMGPVRKVRYQFLDRVEVRDSRRGATFCASVPREEVVLVSLQAR